MKLIAVYSHNEKNATGKLSGEMCYLTLKATCTHGYHKPVRGLEK